jgi:hypothetical protein
MRGEALPSEGFHQRLDDRGLVLHEQHLSLRHAQAG